ncbi:MAG: MarR family winged helix-turn-helix transcriptional regulator [Bacilli bacterium]
MGESMETERIAAALMSLQQRLGGQYGALSRPQFRLLLALRDAHRTISELADNVRISSPGVTQMVDKLQAAGYVIRQSHSDDQRVVLVVMTASGAAALDLATNEYHSRVKEVLSALTDTETQLLRMLLDRLV